MKKWCFLFSCFWLSGCVTASTPLMKRNLCDNSIPGMCYDWGACRRGSAEHCARLGTFYQMAHWYSSIHVAVARQLFQRACHLQKNQCQEQKARLTRSAIRYVLYSKWLDFYNCITWWLRDGTGRVYLSFEISADGSVDKARVAQLILNRYNADLSVHRGLTQCYRKELNRLKFLPTQRGQIIPYMFSVPFRL